MTSRSPRLAKTFHGLVEATLWAFTVCALGYVGLQVAQSKLYQERASAELEESSTVEATAGIVAPRSTRGPDRSVLATGDPLARLEIPRLGISAIVAEGSEEETLKKAIGHVPGTALPGDDGNVALAAHRDTFFRGLGDIRAGDRVLLDAAGRTHTYRVSWTQVVQPSRVDVTHPTEEPSLTLVTCYPFRWIGPAPQRFVVRAILEPSPARATPHPSGQRPRDRSLASTDARSSARR